MKHSGYIHVAYFTNQEEVAWFWIATSGVSTSEHRAGKWRSHCGWGTTQKASWTFSTVEIEETAMKKNQFCSQKLKKHENL